MVLGVSRKGMMLCKMYNYMHQQMSLAETVGRVSELCNCRSANERSVHRACVPMTSHGAPSSLPAPATS